MNGLSPRVRGNHRQHRRGGPGRPVYPRVCGETMSTRPVADRMCGLSPRVRGKPHASEFLLHHSKVYPRVCGETSIRG